MKIDSLFESEPKFKYGDRVRSVKNGKEGKIVNTVTTSVVEVKFDGDKKSIRMSPGMIEKI